MLITTGDGEEFLAEVVESPPLEYEPRGNDPWIVAELDVDEANVKFIEVTIRGDNGQPVKSMFVNMLRPIDTPDPIDQIRNSSNVPLTLAEIYAGLSGNVDAIPEALLAHHDREAVYLRRSQTFIDAVRVPTLPNDLLSNPNLDTEGSIPDLYPDQKQQIPPSSKDFNVVGDAAFTPAVIGHMWHSVHIGDTFFCPRTGFCSTTGIIRSNFVCTPRIWWDVVGTGSPGVNSCSPNVAGWIRMATWNRPRGSVSPRTYAAQQFFGPTLATGAWSSYAPITVSHNQIFTADWNVPEQKRMAIAVSRLEDPGPTARMMTGFSRSTNQ